MKPIYKLGFVEVIKKEGKNYYKLTKYGRQTYKEILETLDELNEKGSK